MKYHHTQVGTLTIIALLVVIVLVALSLTESGVTSPQLTVLVALAVVLGFFYSLTVEINNGSLLCWFGPGLIRRRILLIDIVAVHTVRNPWYAGWGIRWYPGRYWLWNVSGLDAVEMEFKNGRRFRIGTDEPELLAQAILSNM